jgi:hypothetical protein
MVKKKVAFLRRMCCHLLMGLSLLSFIGCTYSSAKRNSTISDLEFEVPLENATPQSIPVRPIDYRLISTKDSNEWLRALPLGDTLTALLVLNRVDRNNLLRLDTLVFPDTIGIGIDIYSPFPSMVSEFRDVHKIMFISYYAQAFAVYESGERIRWGPLSLGKESTPTPTGLFATNWKSKKTTSTVNSEWVMEWCFNLANFQGVSMHEYALPGFPASHACVRLYKEDAIWLYNWADQWILEASEISVYGTPVVIFGAYPFHERKPWLLMAENNRIMEIDSPSLIEVMLDFLPTVMERQSKRDSLAL